jgi:hypothetical protein
VTDQIESTYKESIAMDSQSHSLIGSDGALGVLATLTGLGVVTIAVAPLALPFLILTLAALLPLIVPVVVLAIPVAIVLVVRAIIRRLTPTRRDRNNRRQRASARRVTGGMANGARRAARV